MGRVNTVQEIKLKFMKAKQSKILTNFVVNCVNLLCYIVT